MDLSIIANTKKPLKYIFLKITSPFNKRNQISGEYQLGNYNLMLSFSLSLRLKRRVRAEFWVAVEITSIQREKVNSDSALEESKEIGIKHL